jgi:hypothetical protein
MTCDEFRRIVIEKAPEEATRGERAACVAT